MGVMLGVDEQTGRPLWRRAARMLLPASVRHRVGTWFGEFWIARYPDRKYLKREVIPAIARRGGKLLLVGCRRYTKHYPTLFGVHGTECWTIDIDTTVARWGAPERHIIGNILDALDYWPASTFDTIVLNGVFGFGHYSVRDQEAAHRVCRDLLKTDGPLILGWNTDRCGDPSGLAAVRNHFRLSSFLGLA